MEEFDVQKLEILFKSDLTVAIKECQRIICYAAKYDSFSDFTSYFKKDAHFSVCTNGYDNKMSHIYCCDCSKTSESLLCFDCFLNGNHQGHKYFIFPYVYYLCSCGDDSKIKSSGFCPKHGSIPKDTDHPEQNIDQQLQSILDTIFTICFNFLYEFSKSEFEKSLQICKFINSLYLNDGFIRLASLSITKNANFDSLIQNIPEYTQNFAALLNEIFIPLFNDQLFSRSFSKSFLTLISEKLFKSDTISPIDSQMWSELLSINFSEQMSRYHIEKNQWDWVNFCLNVCEELKYDFFSKQLLQNEQDIDCSLKLELIFYIKNFVNIQPNEQTQNFFDKMVTEVFNHPVQKKSEEYSIETTVFTSFKDTNLPLKKQFLFYFTLLDYLFISFKDNENLKFDKLIEELDKVDIDPIFMLFNNPYNNVSGKKNENDKLISKFLIKKEESSSSAFSFLKKIFSQQKITVYTTNNYKSFENGGTFFLSLPLFDCFASLFKVDNISRIKLARFLLLEQYQPLRIKIGIISLKKILSIMAFNDLKNNDEFKKNPAGEILKQYCYNIYQKHGVPKLLPILQLVIGLQTTDSFNIKEFFAFEAARELGVFDESKERYDTIFVFLYFVLLLVVDRNYFNFDAKQFIKEQIINTSIFGHPDIKKIYQLIDNQLVDPVELNKIVEEVIDEFLVTKDRSKLPQKYFNDNDKVVSYGDKFYFELKDKNDWNKYTGIMINSIYKHVINRYDNPYLTHLLKIPEFKSEEDSFFNSNENEMNSNSTGINMNLKDFLMTPTVLAIVYHTLSFNVSFVEKNLFALDILILIHELCKNNNSEFSFDENTTISYKSLPELVNCFKNIIFNHHIDENGFAYIENTLNWHNFEKILKMKIKYENREPQSIVDILYNRGIFGKLALEKMNLYQEKDSQNEKSDNNTTVDTTEKENENDNNNDENNNNNDENNNNNDNNNNDDDDSNDDEELCTSNSDAINNITDMADSIKNISNSDKIIKEVINRIQADEDENSKEKEQEQEQNYNICSTCKSKKEGELLFYPLYLYRTKFPFIIDKPPLVSKESKQSSVCDNEEDFGDENELVNFLQKEFIISPNLSEEELVKRTKNFRIIMESILRQQKEEKEELNKDGDQMKRVTNGANFVVQFGMHDFCFHQNCIPSSLVINCLLPNLTEIQATSIFNSNFELISNDGQNELISSVLQAIDNFLDQFTSLFNNGNQVYDIFIELIKSLSGLISTFEIRLRNLKNCLSSQKSKNLARNVFLTAWFAYRLKKKPKHNDDSNLTEFQILIKELIECDEIDQEKVKNFALTIIHSMSESGKKEEEILLFLRRVCLAEYFLLDFDMNFEGEINDLVSIETLTKRYDFHFTSFEDFDFKYFLFTDFPKEFIYLRKEPFNIQIDQPEMSFFNILEYNYLIKYYDDFGDGKITRESEEKKNKWALRKIKKGYSIFLKSYYAKRLFPSVLLIFSSCASKIMVIDQFNSASFEPFYTDKYGFSDSLSEGRMPLYLNEKKYMEFIDLVLSGDFALHFKS